MGRKAFATSAALALLPALVLAADGQVEAARQCAQQKDSLQRLVCYDRIFQAEEVSPARAAPAATAAVAAPVVAAAPAAAAAPALAAPAAAPALGDETLKKNQVKKAEAAPKGLEAQVTAVRESRPEIFRVTLDNGQIWQQMESSNLFHVRNGDRVRIERGSMGGYRMSLAKGSGWVRVTRVE